MFLNPQRYALVFAALACVATGQTVEQFETSVRPVLVRSCIPCHGPGQQSSSLRLDSREAMLKGGNRGPALVPGDAKASLMLRSLRHEDATLKMPVGGAKLKDAEIAAIEKWVASGAVWPSNDLAKTPITSGDPRYYPKLLEEHWAFQPVKKGRGPSVDEAMGAALAPRADRATLIRRLSYVLTGLPPKPLEVDLFVRDSSPNAYERLVDRLLASPHFGEHWARHWMDVMRFAETFGNDWNYEVLGAWHYRDYLIRAFNQDVPYNQLVREHIAGDLLENPRKNLIDGINESLIGTTSFRLGELGHDDCVRFRQIRTDVVDNQIDTLGKAFQGLTIACARCHDHKLDPIPTADYYALYGVLTSSRMLSLTADLPDKHAATKERLLGMKPKIRSLLAQLWREDARTIPQYLRAADRAGKKLAPDAADSTLELERVEALLSGMSNTKLKMEDPLYAWVHAGPELAAKYESEAAVRVKFNQEHFRPFDLDRWNADGHGLQQRLSRDGEFTVASTGNNAITGVYPAGIYTNAVSERLNGSLRSPLVPKDKKFVSLLVMGGKLGARRAVLDNCMLGEDYKVLESDRLTWLKIANRDDQPKLPFYVELATKFDNTRIPDRPGHTKTTPEQLAAPQSYFGIAKAVLHDVDESPRDELKQVRQLFAKADLAEGFEAVALKAIDAWENGRASAEDAAWLDWLMDKKLLRNSLQASSELRAAIEEYRSVETRIDSPRVVLGLTDLEAGYDFPVLVGGDAARLGKTPPRGYLSLIAPGEPFRSTGSGRLELAERIASENNPLTARVMVNRIWQHLFGRGLVASSDNFGVYGEKPTHPELLDGLARRFVDGGWSVKKLIREVVMSETFQQSGYPVHRMEAESIRDTVLAVSGRLDRTLYGPSIQPRRDEPSEYRKLFQGPLDGEGRRSIYIKVTRHEGSKFLETFDFPNPNLARGNRDVSNVPPQALALLNDPFVIEQAGYWAARLIGQDAPTAEARIATMFREALGRLPNEAESARFAGLVKELASLHAVEAGKVMTSQAVWKDVAHAMFNLKEMIYVR